MSKLMHDERVFWGGGGTLLRFVAIVAFVAPDSSSIMVFVHVLVLV